MNFTDGFNKTAARRIDKEIAKKFMARPGSIAVKHTAPYQNEVAKARTQFNPSLPRFEAADRAGTSSPVQRMKLLKQYRDSGRV